MIGDLSSTADSMISRPDSATIIGRSDTVPSFSAQDIEGREFEIEPTATINEEDNHLKDTTGSFADWVTNFILRVIQLLENLPEESVAGGASEGDVRSISLTCHADAEGSVQVVDAVTGACNQICIHLSDQLYDLVLRMVFNYASTNVRCNAVRAIHQLVECVANANPAKTLAQFLPFCLRNIQTELENGASSLRTTASSSPLPSDATLHWSMLLCLRFCISY